MAQRRFGPTRGAGTAIIEKESQKTIEPGALGTTAYTGIMQKGPLGKAFRAGNRQQLIFRSGSFIPESLLPDAAQDFFNEGEGAGEMWLSRITDGTEKTSSLVLKNRRSPRSTAIQIDAGNPGRWGGKKQILIDEYASVTATTLTMGTVPGTLKVDELKDALVSFSAVPGKSFKVISNTALGVLSFDLDVDLVTELGGSLNKLLSTTLANDGLAIGVQISDGTTNPTTEFNLQLYSIIGGITTLVKTYEDLSSDPNSLTYFPKVINDDSESDFQIKVTDLHVGSITADARPSVYAGVSTVLTDTVLTAKIHDEVISSVAGALAEARSLTLGASVIEDELLLTVTTAGARSTGVLTFPGNPADNDTVIINGKTITFKTVVADPTVEVLIGGTAEITLDSLVTLINASVDVLLKDIVFAEKATAATMNLFAQTAGTAGDALTTTSAGGGGEPTWGGATLGSGVDQVWSVVSQKMPFLTLAALTSGVAYAAANEFGFGLTLIDTTKDSSKAFAIADTITIPIMPLEVSKLVGGNLLPDTSDFRIKFPIVSNTASTITVKTGSTMLDDAAVGDGFSVEYIRELGGGYDGIAAVVDSTFETAYDTGTSPLRSLRGKNLGLIKLATPGVTASAVQKAGVAFAGSQNWQYRYEIPANITSEDAADEFVTDTLGKNDFAVVIFPSFVKVSNPTGAGNKLISATGMVHGEEAKIARSFNGFHKAAAGEDAILSRVVALPDGLEDKVLDEEFLNPRGVNVIKFIKGNAVLWGDRTSGLDPAFKFKHQRETLSHFENVFIENFDFIIFALNDPSARVVLVSTFISFFTPELAKGSIVGDSVTDAVLIKIDDENNPQASVDAGDLNAELGIRLVGTVERFIITISKLGVTEAA